MLSLDPADPVSLYSIAWDRHDRNLAHLRHTAWAFKDGAPAEIYSLAQTPDGSLWLGTASGLVRFDGIRFQQYQPPSDPKFNQRKVCSLFATPDGGRPRVRDANMFEYHSGGLAMWIASTPRIILLREYSSLSRYQASFLLGR
jgi:ligand-binding sensor domain-containing protein